MVCVELMSYFMGRDPQAIKRAKVERLGFAANYRFGRGATGAGDKDQAHIKTFLADELVHNRNIFIGRFATTQRRERVGCSACKNEMILLDRQDKTNR